MLSRSDLPMETEACGGHMPITRLSGGIRVTGWPSDNLLPRIVRTEVGFRDLLARV